MQRAKGSSVFLCFFSNASYLLQGVEVLKLPLKDCEAIKGTEFCQVCGGLCLLQREKRFMLWFHKSPAFDLKLCCHRNRQSCPTQLLRARDCPAIQ